MTTRSSAFTLIELLVVVAIIGILAAVGTVSYNGYVSSAKQSSAENAMQQISLAQTEYLSNSGGYYESDGASGGTCSPSKENSEDIEIKLFEKGDIITDKMGYSMCVAKSGAGFIVIALENKKPDPKDPPCSLTMTQNSVWTRTGC